MAHPRSIEMVGKGKTLDVVKDYNWSVSTQKIARDEIPIIQITEYQQTLSSIRQGIEYWANQINSFIKNKGGVTPDPYEALYAVSSAERGYVYKFPFFSTYHHAIQNSWGENKGTIGEIGSKVSEFVTQAARVVYPSAGIESAKSWEGSSGSEYQFTFQLLNTVNPSVDISKNKKLIQALVNNNLLDKLDAIVCRPPAICEIEIPGVRGRTIGVMRTINIENVGQLNKMKIDGKDGLVPDAYQITITVQELLIESRQIWNDALSQKVFAIIESPVEGVEGGIDKAKELVNQIQEKAKGTVDALSTAVGP